MGPDWIEDQVSDANADESWPALADRSAVIVEKFFHGAGQVFRDITTACKKSGMPDCFVFDYMLTGGPPAAAVLGVPWAVVFGLTLPFRIAGWPPFGSYMPYKPTLRGRFAYAFANRYIDWENRHVYRPVLDLWKHVGQRFGNVWEPYRTASLGIVASVAECEFPLPKTVDSNIRFVGPLFPDGRAGDEMPALREFLNRSDDPIIHVTLGLTFSRAKFVLETIVDALAAHA